MMTLYLGQVSRLVHTIKHFLLVTPHLLDVTLYISMNGGKQTTVVAVCTEWPKKITFFCGVGLFIPNFLWQIL